jgi:hypothetical protein
MQTQRKCAVLSRHRDWIVAEQRITVERPSDVSCLEFSNIRHRRTSSPDEGYVRVGA